VFSPCRRYRYILTRKIGEQPRALVAIGLNPSTADAYKPDQTVSKDMGFAQRWQCGLLIKLNAYGFRATDPADLKRFRRDNDAVGAANDDAIAFVLSLVRPMVDTILLGWGNHIEPARQRVLAALLGPHGMCLGTNKNGTPEHELYIPYTRPLQPWRLPPEAP
jgi:hypothetical protein